MSIDHRTAVFTICLKIYNLVSIIVEDLSREILTSRTNLTRIKRLVIIENSSLIKNGCDHSGSHVFFQSHI